MENDTIISVDENWYVFSIKDSLLIPGDLPSTGYSSTTFVEWFGDRIYNNEKYAIIADSAEVRCYNLYANSLIANYVQSFTTQLRPVPQYRDHYQFFVKKDVFDESLLSNASQNEGK